MADADIILEEAVEEGRLVSLAEVKAMLEKAQKDRLAADGELTYEQKIALEHAKRFARIGAPEAKKIVAAVHKALPDLEEKFAIRVADLLPQHPDDVRAILQKSRHDLTEAEIAQLIAIVDEHYTA
ncbi:MAG: DNA-directed polymerase subunit [Thermoplasmata archaeon]|jgi:DNA-directed RNA polymerase subunit F|nr:DNA-directed polymerase subunit [Thermoplasmata archaeon]